MAQSDNDAPTARTRTPLRRGKALRRLGQGVGARLGEAAAKRGFAEPEILLRWPEIVGAEMATRCQPVRITYARHAPGLGATLLVQAPGAQATEVEHLAPQIIERVNAFHGYRAVAQVRITQATGAPGQARGFAEEREAFTPAPRPETTPEPGPAARERAERLTEDIEDPGLRTALARLGARILSDTDRPDRSTPPTQEDPR
ncbi:MAG: DciA family protein [Pseudomonadota bacterium]